MQFQSNNRKVSDIVGKILRSLRTSSSSILHFRQQLIFNNIFFWTVIINFAFPMREMRTFVLLGQSNKNKNWVNYEAYFSEINFLKFLEMSSISQKIFSKLISEG